MRHKAKAAFGISIVAAAVLGNFTLLSAQGTDMPDRAKSSSSATGPASFPKTGEDRKTAMHRMNEACGEDMKKFCRHVQPGAGHILQCLELYESEVSAKCNQWLSKREPQGRPQPE